MKYSLIWESSPKGKEKYHAFVTYGSREQHSLNALSYSGSYCAIGTALFTVLILSRFDLTSHLFAGYEKA